MSGQRLYLVDATAFCYRAYYALRELSTSFGQPTNAVYGFVRMLQKIIKEKKPECLAVCFDVSRRTFRQEKFAGYKMQRPPMPDGLKSQIPLIKQVVAAYGLASYEIEGFEADDVIATLASEARKAGMEVTIVSSDKDILQLVDDHTEVFSPYKDAGTTYTPRKVKERFGVEPGAVADVIALMGDAADNIPGVPGIGEKTATSLIQSFGSVEGLLEKCDTLPQEKLKASIQAHKKVIELNKELVTLHTDLALHFDPGKLKIPESDTQEIFRLFKYLEFKRLLQELPLGDGQDAGEEASAIDDASFGAMIAREEEAVIAGTCLEELVWSVKGRAVRVTGPGPRVKAALQEARLKKTGHDLKALAVSLFREGIHLEGVYFDTMIAAYLINPSRPGYRVTDLSWEYLNTAVSDASLKGAPEAGVLNRLRPLFEKMLAERGLERLFYDVEMPLVEVLAAMECDGIRIDVELLQQLSGELATRLAKLVESIYAASGTQFNINSPKQLSQVLFERLKLPVVKKTKTGASTDEEVLTTLAKQHALPATLLEYRQLTKLKNTYIDTLPGMVDAKTGRIHTSFNQTGTETGRLSSSNPNLQNIPIRTDIGATIRQAIVAYDSRSVLVSFDYSQVELRVLAHISKDGNLIAAFKADKDIHRATAALLYGIDEKEVGEAMRDTAKRVNFGIVYGLTGYGLSRDLDIPVTQAQAFIDAYFARFPRVQVYIQEQIEKARKDGFVTTLLGRRRYLPEIHNTNLGVRQFAERQAVNTPIQGSASDLIKLAMVEIHKEIVKRSLHSRMVLQIHDELLFNVVGDEHNECIAFIRERMEHILTLEVPIRVSIKKGKNWLAMEPVHTTAARRIGSAGTLP